MTGEAVIEAHVDEMMRGVKYTVEERAIYDDNGEGVRAGVRAVYRRRAAVFAEAVRAAALQEAADAIVESCQSQPGACPGIEKTCEMHCRSRAYARLVLGLVGRSEETT